MATSKKEQREKAERVQSQLGGHTKFDPKDHWCRDFSDMKGFVQHIGSMTKVWSWGAHAWTDYGSQNKCLAFRVNGYHHKGLVWMVVNFSDYFDVFYTDDKGMVVAVDKDVFLGDIINVIDKRVEYIPEYGDK